MKSLLGTPDPVELCGRPVLDRWSSGSRAVVERWLMGAQPVVER